MTMSKEQSRERWAGLRQLFCDWDPIGVMDDLNCPRDEYDCLVGPSMRMLEEGVPVAELADFLHRETTVHFGLTRDQSECIAFAAKLTAWFAQQLQRS